MKVRFQSQLVAFTVAHATRVFRSCPLFLSLLVLDALRYARIYHAEKSKPLWDDWKMRKPVLKLIFGAGVLFFDFAIAVLDWVGRLEWLHGKIPILYRAATSPTFLLALALTGLAIVLKCLKRISIDSRPTAIPPENAIPTQRVHAISTGTSNQTIAAGRDIITHNHVAPESSEKASDTMPGFSGNAESSRYPHFEFTGVGYKLLYSSPDFRRGISEPSAENERAESCFGLTLKFANVSSRGSSIRALNVVARVRLYSADWSRCLDIPYGFWLNSPLNSTTLEIGAVEELVLLLVDNGETFAIEDLRRANRTYDRYFNPTAVPWLRNVRVKVTDQTSDTTRVFAVSVWHDGRGWCHTAVQTPPNIEVVTW